MAHANRTREIDSTTDEAAISAHNDAYHRGSVGGVSVEWGAAPGSITVAGVFRRSDSCRRYPEFRAMGFGNAPKLKLYEALSKNRRKKPPPVEGGFFVAICRNFSN